MIGRIILRCTLAVGGLMGPQMANTFCRLYLFVSESSADSMPSEMQFIQKCMYTIPIECKDMTRSSLIEINRLLQSLLCFMFCSSQWSSRYPGELTGLFAAVCVLRWGPYRK
jgi:hypothetical protein